MTGNQAAESTFGSDDPTCQTMPEAIGSPLIPIDLEVPNDCSTEC